MLTAREEREASHNSREQPEPKQAALKNVTYRTDVLARPTLATPQSTAFLAPGFGAVNGQDFCTRRDPLGRFTLFLISQLVSGSRVSLRRAAQDQLEWKLQGESTGPAITLRRLAFGC